MVARSRCLCSRWDTCHLISATHNNHKHMFTIVKELFLDLTKYSSMTFPWPFLFSFFFIRGFSSENLGKCGVSTSMLNFLVVTKKHAILLQFSQILSRLNSPTLHSLALTWRYPLSCGIGTHRSHDVRVAPVHLDGMKEKPNRYVDLPCHMNSKC